MQSLLLDLWCFVGSKQLRQGLGIEQNDFDSKLLNPVKKPQK